MLTMFVLLTFSLLVSTNSASGNYNNGYNQPNYRDGFNMPTLPFNNQPQPGAPNNLPQTPNSNSGGFNQAQNPTYPQQPAQANTGYPQQGGTNPQQQPITGYPAAQQPNQNGFPQQGNNYSPQQGNNNYAPQPGNNNYAPQQGNANNYPTAQQQANGNYPQPQNVNPAQPNSINPSAYANPQYPNIPSVDAQHQPNGNSQQPSSMNPTGTDQNSQTTETEKGSNGSCTDKHPTYLCKIYKSTGVCSKSKRVAQDLCPGTCGSVGLCEEKTGTLSSAGEKKHGTKKKLLLAGLAAAGVGGLIKHIVDHKHKKHPDTTHDPQSTHYDGSTGYEAYPSEGMPAYRYPDPQGSMMYPQGQLVPLSSSGFINPLAQPMGTLYPSGTLYPAGGTLLQPQFY